MVLVIKTCEYCTNISTRNVLKNVCYLDSEGEWGRGKFKKFGSEGKRGKGKFENSNNLSQRVKWEKSNFCSIRYLKIFFGRYKSILN